MRLGKRMLKCAVWFLLTAVTVAVALFGMVVACAVVAAKNVVAAPSVYTCLLAVFWLAMVVGSVGGAATFAGGIVDGGRGLFREMAADKRGAAHSPPNTSS